MPRDPIKYIEQNNSKNVNNNKDVKVLVIKSKKVATTTVYTLFFSLDDKKNDRKV